MSYGWSINGETMARILLSLLQHNSRLLLIMTARNEIWMSDTQTDILSVVVCITYFRCYQSFRRVIGSFLMIEVNFEAVFMWSDNHKFSEGITKDGGRLNCSERNTCFPIIILTTTAHKSLEIIFMCFTHRLITVDTKWLFEN
jgi:hypothetical protein